MEKRRFVVCFDGTWNTPDKGANPTNVVKMVRAVRTHDDDGISQVVFYDKGVGTAGGTDALTGGGFGRGLTANVIDGYRFLANNFDPGDEIYIFGFSRGAYTARSLAGLIGLAGLLTPANLGSDLLEVMKVYQNDDLKPAQKRAAVDKVAEERKFQLRRMTRIKCVGVWDTVGSLGIPGDLGRTFLGGKYYFHDVELAKSVEVALHAVALDEKRSAFSPTLWVSDNGLPPDPDQTVEQVWFAGSHSNVGGSYADSKLSDIAFDWMVKRVTAHTGLALDNEHDGDPDLCDATARSIESRALPLYADARVYPYQRVIDGCIPESKGIGGWFRDTFASYDRRNIPPDNLKTVNEALHVSVLERWSAKEVLHDCKDENDDRKVAYRPVNLKAVIDAYHAGKCRIQVVGWDGQVMNPSEVAKIWPAAG